jgi:hypothetical protein
MLLALALQASLHFQEERERQLVQADQGKIVWINET